MIETSPVGLSCKLTKAICLYEHRGHNGGGYASLHDVHQLGDRPVLGPGIPATKSAMRALFANLNPDTDVVPEFIPGNVLAQGSGFIAWWAAPSERAVFFDNDDLGGKVSAKCKLPGLVFAVVADEWFIWAVKGKARPTPDTQLWRSPFYNVWKDGKICTGSVSTPKGDMAMRTELWERAFFESWSTHSNVHGAEKLVKWPGGHVPFWKAMLAGEMKSFPERSLVSLKSAKDGKPFTLQHLIEVIPGIIKGGDV